MSKPANVIGRDHPHDGNEWDCFCARCGSSLTFEQCENCEDGYSHHDCGEDCCVCADPYPNVPCDVCEGRGSWPVCLSSAEWCEAHPMPGREKIPRSTPEWFVDEPR